MTTRISRRARRVGLPHSIQHHRLPSAQSDALSRTSRRGRRCLRRSHRLSWSSDPAPARRQRISLHRLDRQQRSALARGQADRRPARRIAAAGTVRRCHRGDGRVPRRSCVREASRGPKPRIRDRDAALVTACPARADTTRAAERRDGRDRHRGAAARRRPIHAEPLSTRPLPPSTGRPVGMTMTTKRNTSLSIFVARCSVSPFRSSSSCRSQRRLMLRSGLKAHRLDDRPWQAPLVSAGAHADLRTQLSVSSRTTSAGDVVRTAT